VDGRYRHLAPLAHRRVAVGLTQDALAARLGVTRNHVSMVERGHRCVSRRLAPAWAEALGVAEAWLRDPTVPRTDPALRDLLRDALTDDDLAALHRIRDGGGLADYERAIAVLNRLVATALAPRTENA
jgi:transcriptional regulator with XRE-family HTH domain